MLSLLATDELARRPLAGTMWVGLSRRRRGAVVGRLPDGGWRRAEHGPAGPLVLEVRPHADRLTLQVWGPARTPPATADAALEAARAWAGLRDDPAGFAELVDAHPVLRRLRRVLGTPLIGALPRAAESFGRAVLSQLVQGVEAGRSCAELVAMLGAPTAHDLTAWPGRSAVGSTPAHELRRCGIAQRAAGALHAFAVEEDRMQRLALDRRWHAMDAAVVRIRGAAGWTSAETRLYLGDPDAVSVGDYHIPTTIGWALGERTTDDAAMLQLLAPYAGQRGRVIRLVERAAALGLVETKPRRGPRHATSAHRYW